MRTDPTMDRTEQLLQIITDEVVVIAWWNDPNENTINIQDFIKDGENYIPVFTSAEIAKQQMAESRFTNQLVGIKTDFFVSLLKGNETLVFNPDKNFKLKFSATEFTELMGTK